MNRLIDHPVRVKPGMRVLNGNHHGTIGLLEFILRLSREITRMPFASMELKEGTYWVIRKSFALVGATAFMVGLVLASQTLPALAAFGADPWLPELAAVSIVREIGPMLTALIFAVTVGSGFATELGIMKSTGMFRTSSFKERMTTRILSCTLILPIMTLVADAISLFGAYLGAHFKAHMGFRLFFFKVFESLSLTDFAITLTKTLVFGFAIGFIGCYAGYTVRPGQDGVAKAVTAAVVFGALTAFVIDMLAAQISSFLI